MGESGREGCLNRWRVEGGEVGKEVGDNYESGPWTFFRRHDV